MGLCCGKHGVISLELRQESFYLHSAEPNETIELLYTDVQDLLDALMESRVRQEWDNNKVHALRIKNQEERLAHEGALKASWQKAKAELLVATSRYQADEISRQEWLRFVRQEEETQQSYEESILN